MLGLLDHEDEQVRRRAYTAVAQNSHPTIRRFALDHLQQRIAEPNFLELFIQNFQSGDEDLLLGGLRLPDDTDQAHGFLFDLIKIPENNPEARCRELALLVYRWTPCGNCRYHAVKLLVSRNATPAWLVEEYRHDSES